MKITEILVESQQLDEGPILNKIGSAVGKAAGAVAKGVGAVAGGVVGAGKALAKGYQAGKTTVGAAGDDEEPDTTAQPSATGGTSAATGGTSAATGGTSAATGGTSAATGGTSAAPAPAAKPTSTFGKLSAAANGQTLAADPAAGGTQYAQVKANIDKLDKKGKQRILQLLQKEVGTTPAAPAKPAADPGAGAMGNMAGQLAKGGAAEPNTMANAPVSKTNTAKPGNPNAAAAEPAPASPVEPAAEPAPAPVTASKRTGGKVAGQLSQTPSAIRKREATARKGKQKPAAPDQATIDADRERIMGPTSDSIIRTRPIMAESFSLFRKR
jgi:hypothetical protein